MTFTQRPAELDDLERLEGQAMTGAQYSYLTFRWSRLRDDRLDIEDRVTALLRERQCRRAAIHRAVVRVVEVALVGLIAYALSIALVSALQHFHVL